MSLKIIFVSLTVISASTINSYSEIVDAQPYYPDATQDHSLAGLVYLVDLLEHTQNHTLKHAQQVLAKLNAYRASYGDSDELRGLYKRVMNKERERIKRIEYAIDQAFRSKDEAALLRLLDECNSKQKDRVQHILWQFEVDKQKVRDAQPVATTSTASVRPSIAVTDQAKPTLKPSTSASSGEVAAGLGLLAAAGGFLWYMSNK